MRTSDELVYKIFPRVLYTTGIPTRDYCTVIDLQYSVSYTCYALRSNSYTSKD